MHLATRPLPSGSGGRHAGVELVIQRLARLVGVAMRPRQAQVKPARLKDLAAIRNHLMQSIEDCVQQPALSLRQQIDRARTPQELWLLRNDVFQVISRQHDQSVAAQRIDALMKQFEGLLDPKQLVRIR